MRRMKVTCVAAIMLVWSAIPAMATLTPVKVIGGPANQYWPSSNGTYLAWSSRVNNTFNRVREDAPEWYPSAREPIGHQRGEGSFVGSSNVLVYNQWAHAGGRRHLVLRRVDRDAHRGTGGGQQALDAGVGALGLGQLHPVLEEQVVQCRQAAEHLGASTTGTPAR